MNVADTVDLIRSLTLWLATSPSITSQDHYDLLDIEERCNAIEARRLRSTLGEKVTIRTA